MQASADKKGHSPNLVKRFAKIKKKLRDMKDWPKEKIMNTLEVEGLSIPGGWEDVKKIGSRVWDLK